MCYLSIGQLLKPILGAYFQKDKKKLETASAGFLCSFRVKDSVDQPVVWKINELAFRDWRAWEGYKSWEDERMNEFSLSTVIWILRNIYIACIIYYKYTDVQLNVLYYSVMMSDIHSVLKLPQNGFSHVLSLFYLFISNISIYEEIVWHCKWIQCITHSVKALQYHYTLFWELPTKKNPLKSQLHHNKWSAGHCSLIICYNLTYCVTNIHHMKK